MRIKKEYPFSKVGVNEVQGLKKALHEVMEPIREKLNEHIYWDDKKLIDSEYTSRDGFIPHAHNCGGVELILVIPKCEEYDFGFLEFGECDECGKEDLGLDRYGSPKQCGYNGDECAAEADGHLNAKLRIWLKFEGIEDGKMNFWLYLGGGNGDAPYFRTKYEADVFEKSFQAKNIIDFKKQAKKAVNQLIKKVGL